MDLGKIGWGGMNWIDLAQDRDHWKAIVNVLMNLRISYNFVKFLSGCKTCGFSKKSSDP
jgi:hypothetical protein